MSICDIHTYVANERMNTEWVLITIPNMRRDIFLHTFTLTFTCRDTYDHYIFHIFSKAAKNCKAKTFEMVESTDKRTGLEIS